MMNTLLTFEFDLQKALEAIIYLANKTQEQPTFMRVVKLMYLADKTSLEQYGRFISGDTYYAMKDGPVPTHTYDILKDTESNDKGFEVIHRNYPTIKVHRDANLDYLSESDTICLDKTLAAFDHHPTWRLREISHDEAWEATWEEAQGNNSVIIPIQRIADLLENSEELLDYLATQNS
ncbi:MAG: Panacea domain-containing protein [Phototrophicaceae bacterium]